MEIQDKWKYKPTAMKDAFQEAMRKQSARGGNPPTIFNMTKLPVGAEVVIKGEDSE